MHICCFQRCIWGWRLCHAENSACQLYCDSFNTVFCRLLNITAIWLGLCGGRRATRELWVQRTCPTYAPLCQSAQLPSPPFIILSTLAPFHYKDTELTDCVPLWVQEYVWPCVCSTCSETCLSLLLSCQRGAASHLVRWAIIQQQALSSGLSLPPKNKSGRLLYWISGFSEAATLCAALHCGTLPATS